MTIIPCDCNCIYQADGYCRLEKPSYITNNSYKGCAYFIENSKDRKKYYITSEPKR